MGVRIAAATLIIVITLVLLSVFAPMQSKNGFWIVVRRVRSGMDRIVYWFFNACAIATILYVVCMAAYGLIAVH